jgi:RHS repeat-associated protein
MKIKVFYEKENLFLPSPMSGVQCPQSVFCPVSDVYCLMSDFPDYMHFRYYASTMGRFLKPDNIIPNPANPQSWNLYSYVNSNPVNFNDPSGHDLRGKQGKMGMHQALMGVPNVDVSGMLTPVEIYEWFSGNILYDNVPTAAEYFRNQSIASTPRPSNGFQFSSPYGYTAGDGTPDWSNETSSAMDLVFTVDPSTGNTYSNEIALSYQDANFLADTQRSYSSEGDLEIGFYYRSNLFCWDSSGNAGFTKLNPQALQFFSTYYGHVHPQAGTLINGKANGMGPSVGDCKAYLYLWENRITTGFIVQRDSQSRLAVYQFHAITNSNLTMFWWSMHYGY